MAGNQQCLKELGLDCPRIPRFSNAYQSYKGDPLGIPCCRSGVNDSADATRALNENRRTVSRYRTETIADTAPVFNSGVPNQTLNQGESFSLNLPEDLGGNPPLFYSLSPSLPPELRFNKHDRTLSGTPTLAIRPTTYTYTVTDSDGDTDSFTFEMEVSAGNSSEGGVGTRYNLELPGRGDVKSGVHVISGWACDARRVEVSFNDGPGVFVPYGSSRLDKVSTCGGEENTGFATLFNYNNLRKGRHTISLYLDGVLKETRSFRVITIGKGEQESYLVGESGEGSVLLNNGKRVYVKWSQSKQGFNVVGVDGRESPPEALNLTPVTPKRVLEVPGDGSIQSGVHVLSGWVCSGEKVEIDIVTADSSNHIGRFKTAYNNERLDTLGVCGDTDNGFVSIFNYSNLLPGEYSAKLYVDGEWQDSARFKVLRVEEDIPFIRGLKGSGLVDLNKTGKSVQIEWKEELQGFGITDVLD